MRPRQATAPVSRSAPISSQPCCSIWRRPNSAIRKPPVRYYRLAAQNGHVDASLALAELHASDAFVKKDLVEAHRLLSEALNGKDANATKIDRRREALVEQMSVAEKNALAQATTHRQSGAIGSGIGRLHQLVQEHAEER